MMSTYSIVTKEYTVLLCVFSSVFDIACSNLICIHMCHMWCLCEEPLKSVKMLRTCRLNARFSVEITSQWETIHTFQCKHSYASASV